MMARDDTMSPQPDTTAPKPLAAPVLSPGDERLLQLDSAASAALALAVTSARVAGQGRATEAREGASSFPRGTDKRGLRSLLPAWSHVLTAAVALLAGWGADRVALRMSSVPVPQDRAETARLLRDGQEAVLRLTGDVRALKVAVESLKDGVDQTRTEAGARQAQILQRLDQVEAAPATSAALARLSEQIGQAAARAQPPADLIEAFGDRLQRIEQRITAAADGAGKPQAPAVQPAAVTAAAPSADTPALTGSLDPQQPAKDAVVDGWVLHEVYDGVALIESRARRLVEVGPGEMVPGVGRVEAIERRGKRWVVVTNKGVIGMVR